MASPRGDLRFVGLHLGNEPPHCISPLQATTGETMHIDYDNMRIQYRDDEEEPTWGELFADRWPDRMVETVFNFYVRHMLSQIERHLDYDNRDLT
jgi:hypothetical protein